MLAQRMALAAKAYLATLDHRRRDAVRFAFDDDERFRWDYRPDGIENRGRLVWHEGLRLVNMTPEQQAAALALLETGLSARGNERARAVMQLEASLREEERIGKWVKHVVRDPELYAFAIFGDPGAARWAWRVGGHHLGLHFTIVDGTRVASTPMFFGANPAEVRHGATRGLRTLAEEEDLARDVLRGLAAERRACAIVSTVAPRDIMTDVHRIVKATDVPHGLRFAEMSADEREHAMRLVRLYVDRAADDIAAEAWRNIERAGVDAITFAWLGGERPGEPHYYALVGPTFAIEYDKTQDDANHIHSVWRSFDGDWGEDLLASHYEHAH
jgi:hypothetical protein